MFVEAVLWIARTGSPWRDLPAAFGKWNSIFVRFNRWSEGGVWQRIFAALADDEVRRRLATDGAEALPSSPQEYAADIASEEAKWSEIIRKAGIKGE